MFLSKVVNAPLELGEYSGKIMDVRLDVTLNELTEYKQMLTNSNIKLGVSEFKKADTDLKLTVSVQLQDRVVPLQFYSSATAEIQCYYISKQLGIYGSVLEILECSIGKEISFSVWENQTKDKSYKNYSFKLMSAIKADNDNLLI